MIIKFGRVVDLCFKYSVFSPRFVWGRLKIHLEERIFQIWLFNDRIKDEVQKIEHIIFFVDGT